MTKDRPKSRRHLALKSEGRESKTSTKAPKSESKGPKVPRLEGIKDSKERKKTTFDIVERFKGPKGPVNKTFKQDLDKALALGLAD